MTAPRREGALPTDAGLSPETLAAQALGWVDETTRAVVPPLHASTTYERDPDNRFRSGRQYTRVENPTVERPEALLQALEGGAACLLFSSGVAAATTVFQALEPGAHVVAPDVMYYGLRRWLLTEGRRWGLEVDLVPNGDLDALRAAVRPERTRLVWVETPANPTWDVTDIAGAAEIVHAAGARLAVDGTAATPVLTRPIDLGADLVMHSATKYLNGHTDVLAGALVPARLDELWARIVTLRHDAGAMLGPFEAWLLQRGMRTLFLRVRASCRGAELVAERLRAHPAVVRMLYPGLPDHPGHRVAARQMRGGFGGCLSIRLAGGEMAAIDAAARVRVWKRASSLGGVESLIEHRASVEGPGSPCPPDLLRLSVGIESPEDLVADLGQALDAVAEKARRRSHRATHASSAESADPAVAPAVTASGGAAKNG